MNNNTMMEFYGDGDFPFSTQWPNLGWFDSGNNTFTVGVNDSEARLELVPQGKASISLQRNSGL
jgi:hypothetical protein